MYLLDTNIVSDLMRRPHGRVAERVRSAGLADLCTSVVVAGELRCGAAKRNAARLTQRLAAVLGELPILPIEAPIDAVYGKLRAALEQRGQPINDPDCWIAAQALAGITFWSPTTATLSASPSSSARTGWSWIKSAAFRGRERLVHRLKHEIHQAMKPFAQFSLHRRKPVPTAELGPGFRRESEERCQLNQPNDPEHPSRR